MKQSDIRIGGHYETRVSGELVKVEVIGERQGFIATPIYGYRHDNPKSVHNVGGRRLEYQQSEMARLRAMPRYQRIERY